MIKDKEYWNKVRRELSKNRYHDLKEKGICVDCGFRKPIEGKTRCQICTDLLRERQIESRLKKQEEGRCKVCGKINTTPNLTCEVCTEKNRKRTKEYYHKTKGNKKCK